MQTQNGANKRKILIIEDNELNREILKEILSPEYEVLEAENGEEGIRVLKHHREELSLILLDVYMPVCDGFSFLEMTQKDPYLSSVPVLVATGSDKREDEDKCFRLGATDFISKPYQPDALLGRIRNIIRYRESLSTLAVVEYDNTTSVYTMSAFYHHAQQLFADDPSDYDLVVMWIRDYLAINNVYGEKRSQDLLRFIAEDIKKTHPEAMAARQNNYFFILLKPDVRRETGETLQRTKRLSNNCPIPNIRIMTGIYRNVDKSQSVAVLCDRVKSCVKYMAADGNVSVALYDDALEKKRIMEQNLLIEFEPALKNKEFVIRIQPKVDVRKGTVVSGEALVRWIKSDEMISPADFIPLLEKEDKIDKLDEYVFRAVCELQQKRLQKGMACVPISVNLSRNSFYREKIISIYKMIADEMHVDLSLIPIEITESAFASDMKLTELCDSFVDAGFTLHMDDFGSGYSSLSSLAMLPFEVLKIDKSIIDRITTSKGSIIAESIVETAKAVGMKVVAEGVENSEQAALLARMDCDYIQGYLYAKPLTPEEFEQLLLEKQPYYREDLALLNKNRIIKINRMAFTRYLKACRMMFSRVRVVEPQFCRYYDVNVDGSLKEAKSPCYGIWDRDERCGNCIALRSMNSKTTEHKYEVLENNVFLIYAAYVELDGKPMIIEMMNQIGDDVIRGFQKGPTFYEMLMASNERTYLEPVLGVLNRRFYEEQLLNMDGITGVAFLDVDGFKKINDTLGHAYGDTVLIKILNGIKENIRKNDYLVRTGGDEFIIAFTNMDEDYFAVKLEQIRQTIYELSFEDQPEISVSISIGGCICQEINRAAVRCAEKSMFEAKKQRNCVIIDQYPKRNSE